MQISKDNFFSIASQLKLSKEQMDLFWERLEKLEQSSESPFSKYLYYLGALVIISAMTWFMSLGWELFGGGGLFLIASTYAVIFVFLGCLLWNKKDLSTPAGLMVTCAVCMVPLAIYGLQTYFNLWSDSQLKYNDFYQRVAGQWILMELGTIFASLAALRFFSFPFLTAPLFVAAWFLSIDSIPFFFGIDSSTNQGCWVSLIFGLALVILGCVLDYKKKEQYSFWSYLFGTVSFWGGLNCLVWDYQGEWVLAVYLVTNLLMMILSILLRRNVLMVFGAVGVFLYFGHLAREFFKDSMLFPFALTLIGLMIIYLGVLYQKNSHKIESKLFKKLPPSLKKIFENKID